jgi:O-antigen/teichoic acid export membrane protein
MSVSKLLSRWFLSENRQQLAGLAMAAGVAVDIALLLYALPRWGIEAASVAASAAYAGTLAVSLAAFLASAELHREDLSDFPARELRAYPAALRAAWRRLGRVS